MTDTDTFFNIVTCSGEVCIEFDCSARKYVEVTLGFKVEEGEDVCFSKTSFQEITRAIEYLLSKGLPEHRIAVEGRPLALEFSRQRSSSILVCPICGSTRISPLGVAGLTPPLYVCANCGYRGALVLEVEV
ncbi:MAG: hypothetical protein ACP5II_04820 [Infirmifilum sp.]|jgi:predicted RNA-binding Zn-ribbon protein involved in translation (DUF1610 family)|uniref:Uncharacterized protein n=1 Tax=Infirmifilum uzonense TaxID=1550241 RepID=A0A0F7FJ37_9CREN|nr:hypothetical protein [Infirmifilum uzonense]AKG38863.1 hypothetical protein MA03_05740 [Infirmifilum uzonense]